MSIQAILILCWALGFVLFYIRITDPKDGLEPFDEDNRRIVRYFAEFALLIACILWPVAIPFFRSSKD